MRLVTAFPVALCLAGQSLAGPHELDAAIRAGDAAAVAAELDRGTDPNTALPPLRVTPIALAAIRGHAEIVRDLARHGADPNAKSLGALDAVAMAVRSCRATPAVLRALAEAGAGLEGASGTGSTPLMIAIQYGRDDLADELIERGADLAAVNRFGDGVLNFAIYYERPALIRAARRAGAPVEQLDVLFTTTDYYPLGFGKSHLDARLRHCEND